MKRKMDDIFKPGGTALSELNVPACNLLRVGTFFIGIWMPIKEDKASGRLTLHVTGNKYF